MDTNGYSNFDNQVSETAPSRGPTILGADYRDLFEALPVAVYVTDLEGRIVYYNELAAELWGCRPVVPDDRWCGSWKLYWADGAPMPHDQCPMAVAVKERRPVRGKEGFAERPDGTRVPFMPFPTPLYNRAGEMIGAINMIVDITERKKAERRLEELTNELEKQVAERTEELRRRMEQLERLTAELLSAEQRERERLSDFLHNDHQQLLASAMFKTRRLAMLLKSSSNRDLAMQIDLLLREAIEQTRLVTVDLSPPILKHGTLSQAMVSLVSDLERLHGLDVETRIEEGVVAPSDALGFFLHETARELLFNVTKHSGTTRARLELRNVKGSIELVVSDDGAGLDPERLRNLSDSGSGFGLRSIIERTRVLGGSIEFQNPDAGGLRVRIRMPISRVSQATGAETPMTCDKVQDGGWLGAEEGRGVRVIVADDHHLVREGVISIIREDPRIQIVGEAGDGMEALALVRELRPDAVIMDVNMPRLNGIEASRRIRREFPDTRIIGLSVNDDEATIQAILAAGAAAYVTKDAPSEKLLNAIRQALPQPDNAVTATL